MKEHVRSYSKNYTSFLTAITLQPINLVLPTVVE